MTAFQIDASRRERRVVLSLRGELDLATADRLAVATSTYPEDCRTVLLDLGGLEFIDSQGIRALWQLSERVSAAGAGLVLSPARIPVERVFRLTGLRERIAARI